MARKELLEMVRQYVAQLSGDCADDAWHTLVELGPRALPHVIQAFEAECEPSAALALIRAASEYRIKDALPFFAALLVAQDDNIMTFSDPAGKFRTGRQSAKILRR